MIVGEQIAESDATPERHSHQDNRQASSDKWSRVVEDHGVATQMHHTGVDKEQAHSDSFSRVQEADGARHLWHLSNLLWRLLILSC